mgnify:CR=1 FL=1
MREVEAFLPVQERDAPVPEVQQELGGPARCVGVQHRTELLPLDFGDIEIVADLAKVDDGLPGPYGQGNPPHNRHGAQRGDEGIHTHLGDYPGVEQTYQGLIKLRPIENKIITAQKQKLLPRKGSMFNVADAALEQNIISQSEYTLLVSVGEQVAKCVAVDSFNAL